MLPTSRRAAVEGSDAAGCSSLEDGSEARAQRRCSDGGAGCLRGLPPVEPQEKRAVEQRVEALPIG